MALPDGDIVAYSYHSVDIASSSLTAYELQAFSSNVLT
jgi:hypothetical protein